MTEKKKGYDWERIEREYRAGQLSIREISKQFGPTEGAIRYKAKKLDWTRDLTKAVQERTKDKLLRTSLRTPHAHGDDAQIIEEAATRGSEVIQSHRTDIRQGRDMCGMLMAELYSGTKNAMILEELIKTQAKDEEWSDKAYAAAMRAVSLPSRSGVMRDLANSMKVLQGLERTAFNLDEQSSTKDSLDELLDSVMDSSRGIDGYDND